jgi:hypothetical protein
MDIWECRVEVCTLGGTHSTSISSAGEQGGVLLRTYLHNE